MKNMLAGLFTVAMIAIGGKALAAELTVDRLLAQGYTVVGTITSPIGPGVFLQKGASLELCFVSETPTSVNVTTRYCKPVH